MGVEPTALLLRCMISGHRPLLATFTEGKRSDREEEETMKGVRFNFDEDSKSSKEIVLCLV